MDSEKAQLIDKLVGELKVNDEKRADQYEEIPQEPIEAMNKLIKIGTQAVEHLLELLKDASKYSCLYAIKVLGEILDSRAAQPIIDAFNSKDFEVFVDTGDWDEPISVLQKIGLQALEPTLNFLDRKKKEEDEIGICSTLDILVGIKDDEEVSQISHITNEPQH